MSQQNSLYQHVVGITTDYLGPAAQRFVDRQVESHVNKAPEDLTKRDLGTLIEWARLAMAVLTDDQPLIDEYCQRLQALRTKSS